MSAAKCERALAIWQAAVNAVRPEKLLPDAVQRDSSLRAAFKSADRILVVGAGKAGAAMSAALETALRELLDKVEGIVNVPADAVRPLKKIVLNAARPAGSNHPTAEGVVGAERMLDLVARAGPNDVALCILSGGGSALLPAPVHSITLADKQAVTKLLHASGASINEMNAVRKHLSRIKGGRLAEAFTGKQIVSLIISDVVGDPLDVIASGPTAPDPTTFRDALDVLERYQLNAKTPAGVLKHLQDGASGLIPETPKQEGRCENIIIGNNNVALFAAKTKAEELGYRVLNLGPFVEGETRPVAIAIAGIVRSIRECQQPIAPPACILIGGETTVTLSASPGKGGRNQEFALAMLAQLGAAGMDRVAILSGGTDGEDGPTDAAGACVDSDSLQRIADAGLDLEAALTRHDAYPLLDRIGCLVRTGLTQTNVMDVRVILVD
jgi:hydroxypyruvate reductase/glycerate 2-kinase